MDPQREVAEQRDPGETPEVIRIRLLGGFRVSVGLRSIEENEWRRRKAAALIKVLALAPQRRLHRERVMDLLWPQLETQAAANNLHRTLHFARRVLDPTSSSECLSFRDDQLQLCPDRPLWVDVEEFESAAAAARGGREPAAYQAALDLYAGDLLPEDRHQDWTESRRDDLAGMYLVLLVEMAGLYEESKEFESAIKALDRVVALDPTREEAHIGLMRVHAMAGHHHKAIFQYEQLHKALSRELDSEPGTQSRHLYEEIRTGRFPTADPSAAGGPEYPSPLLHNLPVAQSSFVGREREKLEVKRVLSMTGLLTLTGVGGCGKTRLALEVAKDLVGAYPDGVWLVELAALSEEALVPNAVAGALGVREQPGRQLADTLADSIRSKRMLLILDNCEHLIEACAHLVDRLSSSCEHLRVLATSREALGVAGEVNWVAPSLTVPDAGHPPILQSLTRYEAVQLFVERARSRLPTFILTQENVPAVVDICRKLDGIPLAIELATARMTTLAVKQIAERLEDSLGLLTTGSRTAAPRQQTLKATLAWSYELLSEPEQELFGRLSVFAGGWTLEAAEAVGAAGDIHAEEVLDLLSRLVEQSLVVAETGAAEGVPRYRMLEPVRQYAVELLEHTPEAHDARGRHAALFMALAEQAHPELRGPDQVEWMHRLGQENDNLRAAMAWALSAGEAETAVRLGSALWPFWWYRGNHREGRRLVEVALEGEVDIPPLLRIRATVAAAIMTYGQADNEGVMEYMTTLLRLSDQVGRDAYAEAYARAGLGLVAMNRGDFEEATARLEEALPLFIECGEVWTASQTHTWLGTVLLLQGERDRAVPRFEEGLALARQIGDRTGIYNALYTLAQVALVRGEHELATRNFVEGMSLSKEMGDRANVAYCLEGLATVVGARGKAERSARLFGATHGLLETIGVPVWTSYKPDRSLYERIKARVRATLDEAAFEAAFSEGQAMSPEQAIEYALSADEPAPPATSVPEESPPSLSRRQQEVALLIARGLTNRQIAGELTISERTVTTHVAHILNKLGATSRTQVAAWMVEQRLLPEEGPN